MLTIIYMRDLDIRLVLTHFASFTFFSGFFFFLVRLLLHGVPQPPTTLTPPSTPSTGSINRQTTANRCGRARRTQVSTALQELQCQPDTTPFDAELQKYIRGKILVETKREVERVLWGGGLGQGSGEWGAFKLYY